MGLVPISSGRAIVEPSHDELVVGSRYVADVPAGDQLDVTVRLRPGAEVPSGYAGLEREAFEARYASSDTDAAAVRAFAGRNRLTATATNLAEHAVTLRGSAADMARAFGVKLATYSTGDAGTYRGREGAITVPQELGGIVQGVFGLDTSDAGALQSVRPLRATTPASLTPLDVAQAYHFPTGDGAGTSVAVISLGGRYDDTTQAAYERALGVQHVPWSVVNVDGGAEDPSDPGPTGENMLDTEIIGTLVPKADKTMYIAPNTDRGFIDAISAAVHDRAHRNGSISISWGGPETAYSAQAREALRATIKEARAMGINVFAAAGDNGSSDGVRDGVAHVDDPAGFADAIGVGGTKLTLDARGGIGTETAWNELAVGEGATGGGVANGTPAIPEQRGAHVPPASTPGGGRGVPDIAANADPETGYRVLAAPVGRGTPRPEVVGGTSAGAPLYNALAARLAQALGGAGVPDLLGHLYRAPAGDFHDVLAGTNGAFAAGPGWDAVTGRGSVDGARLLADLQSGRA